MARPSNNDIRRLGVVLLAGMLAGAGVRYLTSRPAPATGQPRRLLDWQQARNVALRVSNWEEAPVDDRVARSAQYTRLVAQSEPLIARYLGVDLPAPINRVYVVDRREWLEANFASFEHLFQPIEELYARRVGEPTVGSNIMTGVNGALLGAQFGGLLGFLARRVLGQYDLSLLAPDPAERGTLYFVEPNIQRVQNQLGLPDEDFRLWIALHETTHVFEFEAYPWVREHFNSLLRQYLDQLGQQLDTLTGNGLTQLVGRLTAGRTSGSHWIELMLTPEQRRLFDQIQALMSLVEGYSNHIMNAIGKELLPSFEQIEQRVEMRQRTKSLFEQVFNRITGLDLKLVQYQQGEAFVNAVVAARGIGFAARVWERPANLPTLDEIRDPQQWIARME